jgi:hypothetical protein
MSDLLEPEHNSDSSQRRELVAAKEALAQEKHEQQRSEQEKLDRELLAQQERHQREEAEARIAASSGAVLLPSEILNEATRKVRLTMALVSLFYTGVLILLVVA